jgi:pullulanase
MSRRSSFCVARLATTLLVASGVLAGCGSRSSGVADTGGGGGGGVVIENPVTVTGTFDFRAPLGVFTIGSPPIHARFLGGHADDNGAWIVKSGETATIDFATPVDKVAFDAIDNYTAAVAAARQAASKATRAGAQKFDVDTYVRGSVYNDWIADAGNQLVGTGDVGEVTLPLAPGDYQFKIADAGWASVNCGADDSDTVTLGAPLTLACGTNPPNLNLSITEDANYKFSVNSADTNAPVITVSKVTSGGGGGGGGGGGEPRACGLEDQGLDNTAPFGVEVFIRGSVAGDWAAAPENKLFQFGGNLLKRELQVQAGAAQFKVADAGWAAVNCGAGDSDTLTLGAAFTMACGTNPPNVNVEFPKAACYEFAVNAANPDAPVVTVKEADLSGGGGEEPTDSVEIRIYARDATTPGSAESLLKTVTGTGTVVVNEAYTGGQPRITRIEIENLGTAGDVGIESFSFTANPRFSPAAQPVDVYYRREAGGYAGTTITIDGKTYPCTPTTDNGFGCVAKGVPLYPYQMVNMTVANGDGGTDTIEFNAGTGGEPVYSYANSPIARVGAPGEAGKAPAVPRNANEVILFYKRSTGIYDGWGLHLFPKDPATPAWTTWEAPLLPEGIDPEYGAYFRITLPQDANPAYSANPGALEAFPVVLGFIIHNGDAKDPNDQDQEIRIAGDGNVLFMVSGINDISGAPQVHPIVRPSNAAAHWISRDTVLVRPPAGVTGITTVELYASPDASIANGVTGLQGNFQVVALSAATNPEPQNRRDLAGFAGYSLPATAVENAKAIARGQIYVVGKDIDGVIRAITRTQINGALDDLYADAAADVELGPSYSGGVPSLKLWAPTALLDPGVVVKVYDADGTLLEEKPMTLDTATGVWSVTGDADWDRKFYTYSLSVYSPYPDAIVTNEVTDPYSVSLAADSVRSQLVNLDDADLKPAGWDTLEVPSVAAPEDIVIYETHVRDFSIADPTVPAADRGKFTAFDVPGSNGRNHLERLAAAGLTHVHLLPAFDIATVRERREDRVEIDDTVDKLCAANAAAASLCPANNGKTIRQLLSEKGRTSEEQQQVVGWLRGLDGFNWGYDPWHFGAPEGSYSTDPDGEQRILEFRRMVSGLADAGLGTIMDVVYNHTNASAQNAKSVFDRIVPGYYHRRDANTGNVLRDSCCDDTAPEYRMMAKLTTDTAVRWVRDYKVSGFRFDLMSFHPVDTMEQLRDAVQAVNPSAYVYGEGWNFGAIENDKRFVAARQANLGGTDIGSFVDRIRDGVRGGGPFDNGINHVRNQGFVSGLYWDPNAENSGADTEKTSLLQRSDWIRAFLAGGIETYSFENAAGQVVVASAIDYQGQPAGYTEDPSEAVNYTEKHDNETLWDLSQYKHAAGTPTADRVRAQNVGTSVILLAQGVPFIHAGQDILRSKSMDRNSYDSGDWYNEIDWTLAASKWAVGMPLEGDNQQSYDQIAEALANPLAEPSAADRQFAHDVFREFLRIRKSTTLFRLRTAEQIKSRLTMLNTGPDQVPGVIAYRIDGCTGSDLDQPYGAVVTIFNPTDEAVSLPLFTDETYTLHPVLQGSVDTVVHGATHDATDGFTVPARTTAVFIKAEQTSCAPFDVPMFVRGFGDADWSANPEAELLFAGGTTYSRAISAPAGTLEFKIADANWTAETNCGGAVDGVTLELTKPTQIACFADSKNLRFDSSAAGDYTFTLDAANVANPTLTISKTAPFGTTTMFLRGSITSWDATTPFAWDGVSHYRAEVNGVAAGSYEFKVADAGWTGPTNCGAAAGGSSATLGTPFPLTCAESSQNIGLTIAQAGAYAFAVDGSNPASLSVTVSQMPLPTLYVRGLGGDWDANANTRMTYAGNNVYTWSKALVAGADDFKIADADWTSGSDCGSGTALEVGTPLTLACAGPGNGNIAFTVPAAGRYEFTLNATNPASPQLTVTGP